MSMLHSEFFGNTVGQYLVAVATFAAILLGSYLTRRVVVSRLRALTRNAELGLNGLFGSLLQMVRAPEIVSVALWAASRHLELPFAFDRFLYGLLLVLLTYRAVTMLRLAVDYAVRRALCAQGRLSESDQGTARNLSYLSSGLLWVLAALFVLSNLGFNVSSMLAGLGIGGVAVALAAQSVLGDLFSAFAIYLDRPFVVGDFIVVGGLQGTVEHIGVKTTRVRSLSGEMLVIANSKLTSSDIQNFRMLRERRVVLNIKVPFQTPPEKVRRIPALLRTAVAAAAKARFDRAHLKAFGDEGFEFEAVYFVTDPSYAIYMDINQDIHLAILDAFRKDDVAFALPARSVVLQREGAAPSTV